MHSSFLQRCKSHHIPFSPTSKHLCKITCFNFGHFIANCCSETFVTFTPDKLMNSKLGQHWAIISTAL
ncbi:hypothetical protein X975_19671, partial [Stegodyphus mimosarum]